VGNGTGERRENTWGSTEKVGSILCIRTKEESKKCTDTEMETFRYYKHNEIMKD
jgi:hypothetical protein